MHRSQPLRLWFAAFRHFHQHHSRLLPRPVNSCSATEAPSQPAREVLCGPVGVLFEQKLAAGPTSDLSVALLWKLIWISVLKLLHWAAGCGDDTSPEEVTLKFFLSLCHNDVGDFLYLLACFAGSLFDEEFCGCCQMKQLLGTLSSAVYCVF